MHVAIWAAVVAVSVAGVVHAQEAVSPSGPEGEASASASVDADQAASPEEAAAPVEPPLPEPSLDAEVPEPAPEPEAAPVPEAAPPAVSPVLLPPSSAEPTSTSDEEPISSADEGAVEEASDEDTGENCLGHGESRWVYHHLIAGKYNPLGIEWTGRVGVCAPFIRRPGILFNMSHVEFGISHALSPAYGHLGAFLEWAPLSFLVLRTEATGLLYWEFPMDRAAYFPVESYYDSIDPDDYPPELGQTASGWNVNVFATLRARVSIGRVGVIAINQLGYEIWRVGNADYYVNLRHDVIMKSFDYLISNEAMLMAEIPLTSTLNLRVGAYDSLRYVIEAEVLNNNVGLLAMVNWPRNGRWVRGLTPFVRVGWYTHRPEQRRGYTVAFLGVLFDLDLGSARSRGHTNSDD